MKRILMYCFAAITTLAIFAFGNTAKAQQIGKSNFDVVLESAIIQSQLSGNALEIRISTKQGLNDITLEEIKEIPITQSDDTRLEKPKGDGWIFVGRTTLSDWADFAKKLVLKLDGGVDYIIYTEPHNDGYIYVYYQQV